MPSRKIAEEFVAAHGGDISAAEAAAAIEFLSEDENSYPMHCLVAGMGGYAKVTVNMGVSHEEWFFEGNAAVVLLVGLGKYWGYCYTKDVKKLTEISKGFNINAISAWPLPGGYVNINFFDGHSNFLGHLHGFGISFVNCIGGGVGSWRQIRSSPAD